MSSSPMYHCALHRVRGIGPGDAFDSHSTDALGNNAATFAPVMPALVAGIHVLSVVLQGRRGWPGRSPAMTKGYWLPHAVPRMRRSAQRCGADPGRWR